MKKTLVLKLLLSIIIFAFLSCKDPIFYTISMEKKPIPPLINGSPTNFVVFNNKMYTASGVILYEYSGTKADDASTGIWNKIIPGGQILQLAATNTTLYALCLESGKYVLRKSPDWNIISGNKNVYSIYAFGHELFIGSGEISNNSNKFNISVLYGDDIKKLIDTGNKLINGIAFNGAKYYLSAKDLANESGGCIFAFNAGVLTLDQVIGDNNPFMGIINLDNTTIAAITRKGDLYSVTPSDANKTGHTMGDKLATGALATWEDKGGRRLLLAGRQDEMKNTANYVYGYLELELESSKPNGIKDGAAFREPGIIPVSTITTADGNGIYTSTIGKHAVNQIFQVPSDIDPNMTLFASTQQNGVWSYRNRKTGSTPGRQWNAEE